MLWDVTESLRIELVKICLRAINVAVKRSRAKATDRKEWRKICEAVKVLQEL
jgi:hypothetical protein